MAIRFAGFAFNRRRGELYHTGKKVILQEQPMKLLSLLLDHAGEVVTREHIRTALWGTAHVDHEHGINTAVRKLRQALGRYVPEGEVSIGTSAGRGYRLMLPEQPIAASADLKTPGYDDFLTGRFLFSQRNPSSLIAAKQHFERACERSPEFALAHASLSRTCRFLTIFETAAPSPLWQQAERHALRAVQLDPELSEAHSAVACVLARYRWRWQEGCAAYERALRLQPDDSETLCDFGVALLAMGRFDEGAAQLDRVLALEPHYAVGRATAALGCLMQGRNDEGTAMLTGMTVAMPDFLTAWIYLGIEQLNRGDWADAERSCRRMLNLAPGLPTFLGLLAHAEAGLGRSESVAAIAAQLRALQGRRYISPTAAALVELAAGNTRAACEAVAQAVPQRDTNFALYRRMRLFDPIRDTQDFKRTLQSMSLSEWNSPGKETGYGTRLATGISPDRRIPERPHPITSRLLSSGCPTPLGSAHHNRQSHAATDTETGDPQLFA